MIKYCKIRKDLEYIDIEDIDIYNQLKDCDILNDIFSIDNNEMKSIRTNIILDENLPKTWIEEIKLSEFDKVMIEINNQPKISIDNVIRKVWNAAIDECINVIINDDFIKHLITNEDTFLALFKSILIQTKQKEIE